MLPSSAWRDDQRSSQGYRPASRMDEGRPPFIKKKGLGSFRLTGSIVVSEKAIVLPRLGRLRLKEREYLPTGDDVQILSATVSEQAGHWYVSLQVEQEQEVPENTGPVVGIDLGIKSLATLSDGEVIPNPRHLKRRLKKLKRLQRVVSRRKKGKQEPQESGPQARSAPSADQEPTPQYAASGHHQAAENQVSAGH
jgi:transposase